MHQKICFVHSITAGAHYEVSRAPEIVIPEHDPFEGVFKNIPTKHFVLRKVQNCEYCAAFKFPGEGFGFCCRKEKVNIFTSPIPNDLHRLFTSQLDRDAIYFRKNIHYFNSHFSFTSFGA